MNRKNKLSKERIKLIRRIDRDMEDCEIEDRKHILNIIAGKLGMDKLYEENTGTRLSYSILNIDMLKKIDIFIKKAKEKTKLNLDCDSDDSSEEKEFKLKDRA